MTIAVTHVGGLHDNDKGNRGKQSHTPLCTDLGSDKRAEEIGKGIGEQKNHLAGQNCEHHVLRRADQAGTTRGRHGVRRDRERLSAIKPGKETTRSSEATVCVCGPHPSAGANKGEEV